MLLWLATCQMDMIPFQTGHFERELFTEMMPVNANKLYKIYVEAFYVEIYKNNYYLITQHSTITYP